MSRVGLREDAGGRGRVLSFDRLAQRIGVKLRDCYGRPEAEPLPIEHVDLLLRLRQKEREQSRMRSADPG